MSEHNPHNAQEGHLQSTPASTIRTTQSAPEPAQLNTPPISFDVHVNAAGRDPTFDQPPSLVLEPLPATAAEALAMPANNGNAPQDNEQNANILQVLNYPSQPHMVPFGPIQVLQVAPIGMLLPLPGIMLLALPRHDYFQPDIFNDIFIFPAESYQTPPPSPAPIVPPNAPLMSASEAELQSIPEFKLPESAYDQAQDVGLEVLLEDEDAA